jgi:hypothetical protein
MPHKTDPELAIFSTPVVNATCQGVPIVTYGYTHILSESPDLVEDAPLQVGNAAPRMKVHPKKSWEISDNRLGATAPRMPRTAANDYLPLEGIHLIDGDPTTCWCSHTLPQADTEPAWIRLDLPVEREITRIVLRKRVPGAPRNGVGSMRLDAGAVEVGMAMPAQLEVRVSRDGQQWDTLFCGPSEDNRLYQPDPARHLPQLWEWYYENPRPPSTPEALEAWARYIRFMARHFRGRVRVFELWNEWNIDIYWGEAPSVELYLTLARIALPILREECPEAQVMLGSVAGFTHGMNSWTPAEWAEQEQSTLFLQAIRALAPAVDLIGWHPFYQTDPASPNFRTYADDVRAFKAYCAKLGFRGDFMASEWTASATYPPPTPPNWWGDFVCSEVEKAKIVAQLTVTHTALATGSFFCETWSNYYPLDLTLLRRSFTADPISTQQPQAAYYTLRNLATALEALQPADVAVQINGGPADLQYFTLARPGEQVLTFWQTGRPHDDCPGVPCDLQVDGHYRAASAYDPLNGLEQPLVLETEGGVTRLVGILVKDYPVLIRLRA